MFLHFIELLKSFFFFTGSYSNNVFPPALSNEEEEECIKKMKIDIGVSSKAEAQKLIIAIEISLLNII